MLFRSMYRSRRFFFEKSSLTHAAATPFPQKVPLGTPVRLQARSRRRFVATNFLRFAEAQPESIFHIIRRKLCIARDDFSLKNPLSLTPLRPTSQTSSPRSLVARRGARVCSLTRLRCIRHRRRSARSPRVMSPPRPLVGLITGT